MDGHRSLKVLSLLLIFALPPSSALGQQPPAPVLLTPSGPGQAMQNISYTWQPVGGALYYYLYVARYGEKYFDVILTASGALCPANCSVTPTVSYVTGEYVWLVIAIGASGTSDYNYMIFQVGYPPLSPTTLLAPTGSGISQNPTYEWGPSAGATSYFLAVVEGTQVPVAVSVDAASACGGAICSITPDVDLLAGVHGWVVQPRNEVGGGPYNNPVGVFTVGAPQTSPTPVSPWGSIPTDVPTYVWSSVPGATQYTFLLQQDVSPTSGNPQWQSLPAVPVNATFDCDPDECHLTRHWVLPADLFRWFVRAENEFSVGPWSGGLEFTVPPVTTTSINGITIDSAATWTQAQSPYVVNGAVAVNASLTIQPGVQVRFQPNSSLSIRGEITAQGTPEAPIIFTSSQAVASAGSWSSIQFENASSPNSILENAFIGYAGGGVAGPGWAILTASSPTLRNVTIMDSGGRGVFVTGASSRPVLDQVVIRGAGLTPLDVQSGGFHLAHSIIAENVATYAASLPAGTVWTEEGTHTIDKPIELRSGTVASDATWWNVGTPYVSPDVISIANPGGAKLTIEPGVEIRFKQQGRLEVGGLLAPGTLMARGTATAPVVFTSNQASKSAGDWRRIEFQATATGTSVLENAIVEYAGYDPVGAIVVAGSSPTITGTIVRQSGGNGIYVTSLGAVPLLRGNHFEVIPGTALYNNVQNAVLDARGSFWSHANGPNQAGGEGFTNPGNGSVLFEPWLEGPLNHGLRAKQAFLTKDPFNKTIDRTSLTASLSSPAGWVLEVIGPDQQLKKRYLGFGAEVGQTWEGSQSPSGIVPDGTYRLRLKATEGANNETMAPLVADVAVTGGATNAPTSVVSSPLPGAVLQKGATVPITGTATDPNDFVSYTLEYGAGLTPTSWTLLASGSTPFQNATFHQWNTTSVPSASSTYTLRLTTRDATSPPAVDQIVVQFLEVKNLAADRSIFSPTTTILTKTVTISGQLSLPATWALSIKNSGGTTVRTFAGTGTSITALWDGKNAQGAVVTDGAYTYFLLALHESSGVGVTSPSFPLVVDTMAPTAVISSPTPGANVSNVVSVVGTASDAVDFRDYRLDYALPGSPNYWAIFQAASASNPNPAPVVNGALSSWTTNDKTDRKPLLVGSGDQSYDIRLQVFDEAGNMSQTTVTVNVQNVYITDVSRLTPVINPAAGQTATVRFMLSKDATVTLRWAPEFPPGSSPVRTVGLGTKAAGVLHSATFDGKNDVGILLRDEAFIYKFEATTGSGLSDVFEEFYYNRFTNPLPKYVTVTDFDYSPLLNRVITEAFSISSGPARGSFRVEYKDSSGATYQVFPQRDVLFSNGVNEVFWDGRSASGAVATDVTEVNYLISGFEVGCNPCTLGDQTLFYGIKNNYVEIKGTVPRIDPESISVDPYLLVLSYGQVARLRYELSTPANVTVVVTDPNGNHVKTVASQVSQPAGVNQVVWDGTRESGGPPQPEGNYTFTITATHPTSGHSATAKGNLIVEQ